jgi:hypothetical protein
VVVGGTVVVVVGGEVVVVGVAGTEDEPWSDAVGWVVGGDVTVVEVLGVEVLVVVVVGACIAAAVDEVPPGCSLATTTPMAMVAPVAARAARRVRKRTEAWARRRVSGECEWRVRFIYRFLGSRSSTWKQRKMRPALNPSVDCL